MALSIFLPQPHHLSAVLHQEALGRGHWACSFITHRWRPHSPSRLNRLILDDFGDTDKAFSEKPSCSLCTTPFSLNSGITMKSTFTVFVWYFWAFHSYSLKLYCRTLASCLCLASNRPCLLYLLLLNLALCELLCAMMHKARVQLRSRKFRVD